MLLKFDNYKVNFLLQKRESTHSRLRLDTNMITTVVWSIIITLLLVLIVYQCLEALKKRRNADKIAVIYLRGMITDDKDYLAQDQINFDSVKHKISGLDLRGLKAVILNISSPGGLPVQTDRISTFIRNYFQGLPIICFVEEIAASGGYWLACSAQHIYATRSSVVGSIGVISQSFGFSAALDKLGVERRIITAGSCKNIMDPFSPIDDDEVSVMTNMLSEIHQHFIDHVKESRGDRLKGGEEELFNGKVWTGAKAAELGLVDGVEHMETYITETWGHNVQIIMPKERENMLSKLLNFRRFPRMFPTSHDRFHIDV